MKRLDGNGEETGDSAKYSYGGKELDGGTNLYYFNARYYDATIGRFINVDPIQDGSNWYVYCNNNPLCFVDPTGLGGQPEIQDREPSAQITAKGDYYIGTRGVDDNRYLRAMYPEDAAHFNIDIHGLYMQKIPNEKYGRNILFENPQNNIVLLALPKGTNANVKIKGLLGTYNFELQGGFIYNIGLLTIQAESEAMKYLELSSMKKANTLDFVMDAANLASAVLGPFAVGASMAAKGVKTATTAISVLSTVIPYIGGFRATQNKITKLRNKHYDLELTNTVNYQAGKDWKKFQDWISRNYGE